MKKFTKFNFNNLVFKLYKKQKLLFQNPSRKVAFFYLVIFIMGAVFLSIPLTHESNVHVKFIDALFLSASAFSDTGLSVVDSIYATFN